MNEGPERIDYRETSDVTEVHAAIKREHRDPSAEVTPIPLWLTAVCGIAICWAGAYIGVFNGGFSADVYNEYESSPSLLFPIPQKAGGKSDGAAVTLTLAQQGKVVYAQCLACHQATGQGVPGAYPPLVHSEFVIGGEKRLLAIILKGLQGPLTVEGKVYNGAMPPWEKALSDKKIAAVASYIRSEWGNPAAEISEAKVAAARKEFESYTAALTEAQLLQIPADANFPDAPGGAAAPAPDNAAILALGKQNYMSICVACHQPTGTGLPPVFPPLAKSEYVTGNPKRLAAIILKGVMGPITVEGTAYNSIMPAQEASLTDAKVAAIATYVRASFGNTGTPVSTEVAAAVRKEFAEKKTSWTEAELKNFDSSATVSPAASAPASGAPAPAAAQ